MSYTEPGVPPPGGAPGVPGVPPPVEAHLAAATGVSNSAAHPATAAAAAAPGSEWLPGSHPVCQPGETQSLISQHYVMTWRLLEMLRELVSNMLDAVYKEARIRHGLGKAAVVVRAGASPDVEDSCGLMLGDFDLMAADEVIGRIRWRNNKLTLENPGTIPLHCLLMGGSSNFALSGAEKTEIVGRFGEGMKLAILSSLREGKTLLIHTGGRVWSGAFRDDLKYRETTLHYNVGKKEPNHPIADNTVLVEIGNITREEWMGTQENNTGVHSFLTLMDALAAAREEFLTYTVLAHDPNLGGLLLAPHLAGKIFNNGVFVCLVDGFQLGYSLIGLTTNRDRGALTGLTERRNATARVLNDILRYGSQLALSQRALVQRLDDLVRIVIGMLWVNAEETHHLHHSGAGHSVQVSDLLLACWRLQEGNANFEPVSQEQFIANTHRFENERLSPSIYPQKAVSWEQAVNFVQASQHVTLDKKLAELAAKPVFDALEQDQVQVRDEAVRRACQLNPAVGSLAVVFKQVSYASNFRRGDTAFLSQHLLDAAEVARQEPQLAMGAAAAAPADPARPPVDARVIKICATLLSFARTDLGSILSQLM